MPTKALKSTSKPTPRRNVVKKSATKKANNRDAAQAKATPRTKSLSKELGTRLNKLRTMKGLTQLQVAIDCGIDRGYISMLENGKYSVSVGLLSLLAECYSTTMSAILDGLK